MARRRVIPTLLTDGVSLVKGEKFQSWRTVGSVVAAARVFSMRDVDELVLMDVRATQEGRTISPEMVSSVAACMAVPLAVGGGVKNLQDFEQVLRSGADKVILGAVALSNPEFITAAAKRFGSQAVIVSIDSNAPGGTSIATMSGTQPVEKTAVDAAIMAAEHGAGEILLQSVQLDGLLQGMDIAAIEAVTAAVSTPVIASSGAGSFEDFASAMAAGADAVAAGGMFQFTEQTPREARDYLATAGVNVRVAHH